MVFKEEVLSVRTVLNVAQSFSHRSASLVGNNLWTGDVAAELSVVGDGVVHICQAAFVDQVNDQLHFMAAFEVSHFRSVAGFNQGFEAHLDQFGNTAAQNALFAEQVGFGFFFEGGFNDAGLACAVGSSVRHGDFTGFTGFVLVNSDQLRNTRTFGIGATNGMAGSLRGNHPNFKVGSRSDLTVVNVEAVGKSQSSAFFQVRFDLFFVDLGDLFVRKKDHHNICVFCRIFDCGYLQTGSFDFLPGSAVFADTDNDVNAGIMKILCVSVALGAVTDDSDFLSFD